MLAIEEAIRLAEESKETVLSLIMEQGTPNLNVAEMFASMYGHVLALFVKKGDLTAAFLDSVPKEQKAASLMEKKVFRFIDDKGDKCLGVLWSPDHDKIVQAYRRKYAN